MKICYYSELLRLPHSKLWHRIFTTTGVLIFCPQKEAKLMTGSD